jgi:hypothetical protein
MLLQSQAELHASNSDMRASVDAEHNRLLRLVSEQAASLAEKERQLEVSRPDCMVHAASQMHLPMQRCQRRRSNLQFMSGHGTGCAIQCFTVYPWLERHHSQLTMAFVAMCVLVYRLCALRWVQHLQLAVPTLKAGSGLSVRQRGGWQSNRYMTDTASHMPHVACMLNNCQGVDMLTSCTPGGHVSVPLPVAAD